MQTETRTATATAPRVPQVAHTPTVAPSVTVEQAETVTVELDRATYLALIDAARHETLRREAEARRSPNGTYPAGLAYRLRTVLTAHEDSSGPSVPCPVWD